ncbi:DUF1648 domain-containing protein [Oceanobacillus sp. CAU 1775]
MNNLFLFISLAIYIPVLMPLIFIPYWTRKTESFGVSIPESIYYTEPLKTYRKQYAIYTAIAAVLLYLVLFTFGRNASDSEMGILISSIIIVLLVVSFLIYLFFHNKMKKLKQNSDWKDGKSERLFISTSFHKEKLTYSNFWFLISFFLALVVIFFTFNNYHLLPDQIPMQYNFSGEVTTWADKSYRSALLLPVMILYMTLLFIFVNTVIARAKQQIDSENPEKSLKQNALFRRRWSLYIILSGISLSFMLAFAQFTFFYSVDSTLLMVVIMLFTFLMIGGAIYLSITTGQGGSRIKHGTITHNGKSINRDEDKYWKLGVFYFNRNDPALFLEKRFGVGWTINLGRPLAWIIFIIIIGSAILLPIVFS